MSPFILSQVHTQYRQCACKRRRFLCALIRPPPAKCDIRAWNTTCAPHPGIHDMHDVFSLLHVHSSRCAMCDNIEKCPLGQKSACFLAAMHNIIIERFLASWASRGYKFRLCTPYILRGSNVEPHRESELLRELRKVKAEPVVDDDALIGIRAHLTITHQRCKVSPMCYVRCADTHLCSKNSPPTETPVRHQASPG